MTNETKTLTKADLAQFTGTQQWFRHPYMRQILYTEGVQYVAETAGAYWLLDEIIFAQVSKSVAAAPFQVWQLAVKPDRTATLSATDGQGKAIYNKPIEYTDFPLEEMIFWLTENVVLLPSEY
jgi:hypothetical protein